MNLTQQECNDAAEKILYSQNPFSRLNKHGHITASGLVIRND